MDIKNTPKSNPFLFSLFNNMEAAVFLVDKNARVQNINKSFTKLFHRSEEEVLNELCGNALGCVFPIKEDTDCGETYHCDECQLRKSIFNCFKQPDLVQRIIIDREFYIDSILQLRYFYIISNYFQYEENEFVLIMIHDITELETTRQELKEANDLKNKFLGIVAHDLKSPISIISMASSYLLEDMGNISNEENKKLLETIQKSSTFMIDLVDNLLDISKIESGALVLHKKDVEYIMFIEKILELNRIIAKSRSISITLNVEVNNIPMILIDKNRIQQVINNLIGNAIKFSPKGAQIIVTIKEGANNMLDTEIRDFGPGIPQNELEFLFEEYKITSVQSSSGDVGNGLGLAISKKIIEKHDGLINLKSEVGIGSVFSFSLPKMS